MSPHRHARGASSAALLILAALRIADKAAATPAEELASHSLEDFCFAGNVPDGGQPPAKPRGRVRLLLRDWLSHRLTTYVAAILLREHLHYEVELVEPHPATIVFRGTSSKEKLRKWIAEGEFDADMEYWWAAESLDPEVAIADPVGYTGRSGLYVLPGAPGRHSSPPDFFRFYGPQGDAARSGFKRMKSTDSERQWVSKDCNNSIDRCVEVLMGPKNWDELFFESLVDSYHLGMGFKYHTSEELTERRRYLTPVPQDVVFYSFSPNWGAEDQGSVRISFPDTNAGCQSAACDYPEVILNKVIAKRLKTTAPKAYFTLKNLQLSRHDLVGTLIPRSDANMSTASIRMVACQFLRQRPDLAQKVIPHCAASEFVNDSKPGDLIFDADSGECRPKPSPYDYRCFADHEKPGILKHDEVVTVGYKDWVSHQILGTLLAILLRDFLGYTVVFRSLQPYGRHDWSFLRSPSIVDVNPEEWFANDEKNVQKWVHEEGVADFPSPVGISGRSGLYVLPHSLEVSPYADYWRFFSGAGPRQAGFKTPNATELNFLTADDRPCTSNPDRFTWCGSASLPEPGFYMTPTCIEKPDNCVEAIMASPSWDQGVFEQLANNMDLGLAMGYYGNNWSATILNRHAAKQLTIFYAWYPHPLLSQVGILQQRGLGRISFPDTYIGCNLFEASSPDGSAKCDYPEQALQKLMANSLWRRAPEAASLIKRFSINQTQLREIFAQHVEGGGTMSTANASCWFVRANMQWARSLAPDCMTRPVAHSNLTIGTLVWSPAEQRCKPVNCSANERLIIQTGETVCSACSSEQLHLVPAEDQLSCRVCPAGQHADKTGARCELCPPGTFSDPESGAFICERCPRDTYNPIWGQSHCVACPFGGECEGSTQSGTGATVFIAKPGFFILGSPQTLIDDFLTHREAGSGAIHGAGWPGVGPYRCPMTESCLGNNTCYFLPDGRASMAGPFCGTCLKGFQRGNSFALCGRCPSRQENVAMLTLILSVCGGIIVFVTRQNAVVHAGTRDVLFVVPKILINFFVLFSVIADNLGLRNVLQMAEEASILPPAMSGLLKATVGIGSAIENPTTALFSIECLAPSDSWRAPYVKILICWVATPCTLLTLLLVSSTWITLRVITIAILFRVRSKVGIQSALEQDQRHDTVGSAFRFVLSKTFSSGESQSSANVKFDFGKAVKRSFTPLAVVALYFLHPMVTSGFFSVFKCARHDEVTGLEYDKMRLLISMDIDCESADHRRWQIAAAIGILTWSFGIPLFLWCVLRRLRHQLQTTKVKQAYGFLYNGFEFRYYHQELIYMVRKNWFLFGAVCPWLGSHARTVLLLAICIGFSGLHLLHPPFDKRAYFALDQCELYSCFTLLLLLLGRLMEESLLQDRQGGGIRLLAYVPSMVCLLWFLTKAIYVMCRPEIWPLDGLTFLPEFMRLKTVPSSFCWGPLKAGQKLDPDTVLGALEHVALNTGKVPPITSQNSVQDPFLRCARRQLLDRGELRMLTALVSEASEVLVRRHEVCIGEAPTDICLPTFLIQLERLLMSCMIQSLRMRIERRHYWNARGTCRKWLCGLWGDMRVYAKSVLLVNQFAATLDRNVSFLTNASVSNCEDIQKDVSLEEMHAALVSLTPSLLDPVHSVGSNRMVELCNNSRFLPMDVAWLFEECAHIARLKAWNNPAAWRGRELRKPMPDPDAAPPPPEPDEEVAVTRTKTEDGLPRLGVLLSAQPTDVLADARASKATIPCTPCALPPAEFFSPQKPGKTAPWEEKVFVEDKLAPKHHMLADQEMGPEPLCIGLSLEQARKCLEFSPACRI